MISYATGDIFNFVGNAICIPVNCKGVMGAGLALQSKICSQTNYKAYRYFCEGGQLRPGQVFEVAVDDLDDHISFIFNLATKDHWKHPSRPEWIRDCIINLVKKMKDYHLRTVAIPALGCGCGLLDWNYIRRLVVQTLTELGELDTEERNYVIYNPFPLYQRTKDNG